MAFESYHPGRYCSTRCELEQAAARGTRNDSPAVCAVCGKPLTGEQRRRAARYCGDAHKQAAAYERRKARIHTPK